jgi:hypothetical protein
VSRPRARRRQIYVWYDDDQVDTTAGGAFAVFVTVWTIMVFEYWKSREATLALKARCDSAAGVGLLLRRYSLALFQKAGAKFHEFTCGCLC